jgi:hypothetical protein
MDALDAGRRDDELPPRVGDGHSRQLGPIPVEARAVQDRPSRRPAVDRANQETAVHAIVIHAKSANPRRTCSNRYAALSRRRPNPPRPCPNDLRRRRLPIVESRCDEDPTMTPGFKGTESSSACGRGRETGIHEVVRKAAPPNKRPAFNLRARCAAAADPTNDRQPWINPSPDERGVDMGLGCGTRRCTSDRGECDERDCEGCA